jgi:hypothetical protein
MTAVADQLLMGQVGQVDCMRSAGTISEPLFGTRGQVGIQLLRVVEQREQQEQQKQQQGQQQGKQQEQQEEQQLEQQEQPLGHQVSEARILVERCSRVRQTVG